MEIIEVKVYIFGEEKFKVFVLVVLDYCFMVNDIKVIQGCDGFFISMLSCWKKNGEFKDVVYLLNNEICCWLEFVIFEMYESELEVWGELFKEVCKCGEFCV